MLMLTVTEAYESNWKHSLQREKGKREGRAYERIHIRNSVPAFLMLRHGIAAIQSSARSVRVENHSDSWIRGLYPMIIRKFRFRPENPIANRIRAACKQRSLYGRTSARTREPPLGPPSFC